MTPERSALIEWLARHPAIRRAAAKHGGAHADEALQRGLLIACEKLPQQVDGINAVKWLTVVVKREAWGLHRAERRERQHAALSDSQRHPGAFNTAAERVLADASWEPHEAAERREHVREGWSAVAGLKPDHKRALYLKALGYSYHEIEELTGWTYTKINRCMAEGRAALRDRGALAVA